MTYTNKKIDRRLRTLLIYSGEKRENLACAAGVTTPVVNRWLSGAGVPDAYQLRDIANFFGMSYEWLLDGKDSVPSVDELAEMLGLSAETVDELLTLAALFDEDALRRGIQHKFIAGGLDFFGGDGSSGSHA